MADELVFTFGEFSVEESLEITSDITGSSVDPVPTFKSSFKRLLTDDTTDFFSTFVDIQPCGLVNQGNTCFQNVVLQSLLACPPFLSLLIQLQKASSSMDDDSEELILWQQLALFVASFQEPALGAAVQKTRKVPMSLLTFFRTFQQESGQQEDAHEFFEYLLQKLHQEFVDAKVLNETTQAKMLFRHEEWEQVGSRKNVVDKVESPILWLFQGKMRSRVLRKKKSDTIEPFFGLHLDIVQYDTLIEAMEGLTRVERLSPGVEKQNLIQDLPLVLTIHLKRFTYHPKAGPIKISHNVHFDMEFKIPNSCLVLKDQPDVNYRLFAAIIHHGDTITNGHYTVVCVNQRGELKWFDDHSVKTLSSLKQLEQLPVYLLLYLKTN